MKKIKIILSLAIIGVFLIATAACEKDENDDNQPPQTNNNGGNGNDNGGGDNGGSGDSCPETFTDTRDNNVYNTVKIGNQCWMAENLKYLPSVVPSTTSSPTAAYYYVFMHHNTDVEAAKKHQNYSAFGALYNWTAATTACPQGWGLPSDNDWKTLEKYLGMSQEQVDSESFRGTDQGAKLAGSAQLWFEGSLKHDSNFGISGFIALPASYRDGSGSFSGGQTGYYGYWWTSTSSTSDSNPRAWSRGIHFSSSQINRKSDLTQLGYSVRCIKQ